jgi:ABC-2 type transport system ATP-binding protein
MLPRVRAIVASGLRKSYGSSLALDDVGLVVDAGEVRGLLGPNGAGKTTLLRILFGLVRPDGGSVEIPGRLAGFVEDPTFYPNLTAETNLEILAMLDTDRAPERIPQLLDVVGLAEQRQHRVGGFSTGMRQRLGIAAALLRKPQVLLLDEPTAGLDPAGIRDVGALLRELSDDGVAVVVSSHQIGEVESICDSYTILSRGCAVWSGDVEALRAQAAGSGYRITTNDDDRIFEIVRSTPGVEAARTARGDVVLIADDTALDDFVLALARMDVAVRRLELLMSPLESMFFALTRDGAGRTMTAHDLADYPSVAAP